ncbi:MAG: transglycosylase SLT domain-containing protein [Roseivivax sp.]|nr:transglycosylase SLT domain-containing protein [Roseivivax sp.]
MIRWGAIIVALLLALPLWAGPESLAPKRSLLPHVRPVSMVASRWDHLPQAARWNAAALTALRSHAQGLPDQVPRDIADWCPSYPLANRAGREAFWVGLLSALAKHESTWRPAAVGGGGRWYGLTQILPSTAEHYGCRATTGSALTDGAANLSCALRIMARTVRRDGVVSRGMRGVAADWGPFHSERKREDMRDWLREQPYCRAPGRSPLPRLRPVRDAR